MHATFSSAANVMQMRYNRSCSDTLAIKMRCQRDTNAHQAFHRCVTAALLKVVTCSVTDLNGVVFVIETNQHLGPMLPCSYDMNNARLFEKTYILDLNPKKNGYVYVLYNV